MVTRWSVCLVTHLKELKLILDVIHLKVILTQTIQITWIDKNHFKDNVSKHKSIKFKSFLSKINFVKIILSKSILSTVKPNMC